MTDPLDELLFAVREVITHWSFFPTDEYGSDDALISTRLLLELDKAYVEFQEAVNKRNSHE